MAASGFLGRLVPQSKRIETLKYIAGGYVPIGGCFGGWDAAARIIKQNSRQASIPRGALNLSPRTLLGRTPTRVAQWCL
jgi:hypothetical protein